MDKRKVDIYITTLISMISLFIIIFVICFICALFVMANEFLGGWQ